MRTILLVALVLVSVLMLGYVRLRGTIRHNLLVWERISSFLEALRAYIRSDGADAVAYTRLLSLSTLLQSDLGPDALVSFKPAFSQTAVPHYPALINHVPALNFELNIARFKDEQTVAVYAANLQEILLRAEASIDKEVNADRARLRNPFGVLLAGIQATLMSPVGLMVLAGAVPGHRAQRWSQSTPVRLASVVIFLFGLLASAITVVLGWPQFVSILRGHGMR